MDFFLLLVSHGFCTADWPCSSGWPCTWPPCFHLWGVRIVLGPHFTRFLGCTRFVKVDIFYSVLSSSKVIFLIKYLKLFNKDKSDAKDCGKFHVKWKKDRKEIYSESSNVILTHFSPPINDSHKGRKSCASFIFLFHTKAKQLFKKTLTEI